MGLRPLFLLTPENIRDVEVADNVHRFLLSHHKGDLAGFPMEEQLGTAVSLLMRIAHWFVDLSRDSRADAPRECSFHETPGKRGLMRLGAVPSTRSSTVQHNGCTTRSPAQ